MRPNLMRSGIQMFHPPAYSLGEMALDVDFSTDEDEIDVYFRDYILNDPGVVPTYYFVQQEDTTNFPKALAALDGTEFKTGDYIIVRNSTKSKYNVYLYTSDDWVTFTGKSAYDTSEGDVNIIIDEDDDLDIIIDDDDD